MRRCIFATLFLNAILIFPSESAEKKALVTVEACQMLTQHIPLEDVTYKAGVDVRGISVVPADLGKIPDLDLKDTISFQLIIDAAKEIRMKKPNKQLFQQHPGLQNEINLGQIVVKDGQVTLDGKSLAGDQQKHLLVFCRKNTKER